MASARDTDKSDFPDLSAVVDALPLACVAVVGDVMLDRFVQGEVTRISPEAPIPVFRIRNQDNMLGGAGNVLANLCGLDVSARLAAVIGDDEPGRTVRALVAARGTDTAGLIDGARPTTIKTRFLAAHQQLLRTDFEQTEPLSGALSQAVLRQAGLLMKKSGALVLSDYGKGLLTPEIIAALIEAARKQGIPVLVDPKGSDYSIYSGASVVTPNRKELAEATGHMPTGTDEEIVAAARFLMEKSGIEAVLATRSQDGMSIIHADRSARPVHLRTEALEVFDVSGAGDTVIATVAACLAAGADLIQAAAIANCAGGIVVAKVGTAAIRRSELKDALQRKELAVRQQDEGPVVVDRAREARICHGDEALEQIARWKARGLKVGFTNGCFDLLHPGHVGYLNRARDKCDRLVVGLNADNSVKRLKGSDRPVNDEQARASVLAALGSVDLVVLFGKDPDEDDKPVRLLQALKPDIFFKGGDYREDQLPEAAAVRANGGDVLIMPLYEGHSTTSTISKLKTGA